MNTLTTINALGYIITPSPTDVQLYSYSTSERLALTNVKRGTMVYDDTDRMIYIFDGTNWDTTASAICDDTDPTKVLEFDLSGLSHATTRYITMPDADIDLTNFAELQNLTTHEIQQLQNIDLVSISNAQWGYVGLMDQSVSQSASPTFIAPLCKQSLALEDPGVGTLTVSLQAPSALASAYSITLPSALPATSGLLESNGSGTTTWSTTPTLTQLTMKGPLNGVRSYDCQFTIMGDSVAPVYPIIQLVFPTDMFYARIHLTTADWSDDTRIAALVTDACGGKPTAGVPGAISVGDVTVLGSSWAQFSSEITTTGDTVSITKTENLAVGSGNYVCKLHVEVCGSSLTKIKNGNTGGDIVVFDY